MIRFTQMKKERIAPHQNSKSLKKSYKKLIINKSFVFHNFLIESLKKLILLP